MISRIPRIAGAVIGALLVSGAAVAVTAHAAGVSINPLAAGSPSPSPSNRGAGKAALQGNCQSFLGYFAKDLNTSTDKVNSAFQDALSKTLADAVKNGQITQAQADKIRSSAAKRQLCQGLAGIRPKGAQAGPAKGKLGVAMTDVLNAVAGALKVSPAQLKTDFQNGQTVQQIATGNGVDEQTFESSVVAALTADLDSALKAGTITQQQHDAMVQRLPQMAKAFWSSNRALGPAGFGGPGGPGGARPGRPAPTPSTTTS